MNIKLSRDKKKSVNRLNVDKKMISILIVFVILGIFLVISIVVTANSLSALRGYASFQTNWTTARKEVTFQLVNYIRTEDAVYKSRMDSSVLLIEKMASIRNELMNENSNIKKVRGLFMETHTIPNDVEKMITTFEHFHEFPDFKESIAAWSDSDLLIYEMVDISKAVGKENILTNQLKEEYIEKIATLDNELTLLQFRLSRSLASGTEFLNEVILMVTVSLGLILILTGGILSFRFLKSIKRWQKEIEQTEKLLKDQLVEKTHLISEVHDRVKNNLALVSTLVQLQQNIGERDESQNNFVNTVSRIRSMALVHERLYQNETFSSIRIDEYIKDLVETLKHKGFQKNENLELDLEVSPVTLSIEQAIPTGLLLNEVLVNALKYGTNSEHPKIKVTLSSDGNDIVIAVADNGPGLPKNTEFEKSATLGFRLISVLIKQLRANFIQNNDQGASFTFRYQIQKYG